MSNTLFDLRPVSIETLDVIDGDPFADARKMPKPGDTWEHKGERRRFEGFGKMTRVPAYKNRVFRQCLPTDIDAKARWKNLTTQSREVKVYRPGGYQMEAREFTAESQRTKSVAAWFNWVSNATLVDTREAAEERERNAHANKKAHAVGAIAWDPKSGETLWPWGRSHAVRDEVGHLLRCRSIRYEFNDGSILVLNIAPTIQVEPALALNMLRMATQGAEAPAMVMSSAIAAARLPTASER